MLDIFNTPTPQQSNYQEFYGGGSTRDWVKPRGASMVRFMLIGAGSGGGNGGSTTGGGGGGSGAITSWIGPAIFIPDMLQITVGKGGAAGVAGGTTSVVYLANDGTGYTLLTANGGTAATGTQGSGGAATANNYFGASGIFNSVAGQDGAVGGGTGAGGSVTASATTFLSGGAGGAGANITNGTVTPNYGYPASVATPGGANKGQDGYFFIQPIPVGRGGAGGGSTTSSGGVGGVGGLGCGGGGAGEDSLTGGGLGGDGAVFIWAW